MTRAELLTALLVEQFAAPVPDWTGPVDGPTSWLTKPRLTAEEKLKAGHAEYQRFLYHHKPIPAEIAAAETAYRRHREQVA